MDWNTCSTYEIAQFFLSTTQLFPDYGTEELCEIQSIFRVEFHFILLGFEYLDEDQCFVMNFTLLVCMERRPTARI